MFKETIKKIGFKLSDYSQWNSRSDRFLMHQLRRKIRYACFSTQRGETKNVPKKFKAYFEKQPHFSGWELFGDRWDVTKEDPIKTYPRLLSTLDEWEAKLRMCVPELPGAIAYKQTV